MLYLDRLTLDSFAGRRVAVLGLARTGTALCRFLADHGALVTAYDARPDDELADHISRLEDRDVRLLLGPGVDPLDAFTDQELICASPAISSQFRTTEPRLRLVLAAAEAEHRIPIVSEIDLFLRLSPASSIAVTGTKGKTTTATLSAAVLAEGSAPVLLGGNTGTPLIDRLPEITPSHRVVLELSELQLSTVSRGASVSVYTNVTADHLDRHGSVAAYQSVKRRLAELAPSTGDIVLNADDPVCASYMRVTRARPVFYSRREQSRADVTLHGGWLVAGQVRVMPVTEIKLLGEHNVSNAMAAIAVGMLFGVEPERMRTAIGAIECLENRLESVLRFAGVHFVNDTQATQPDAVIAALRSFDPPIVLICGGADKQLPLDVLAIEVAARTAGVVVVG